MVKKLLCHFRISRKRVHHHGNIRKIRQDSQCIRIRVAAMDDHGLIFFLCKYELLPEQFLLTLLRSGTFSRCARIIQSDLPYSHNMRFRKEQAECIFIKDILRVVRMNADDGENEWKSAGKFHPRLAFRKRIRGVDARYSILGTQCEQCFAVGVKCSVLQMTVCIHHHASLTT